MLPTNAAGELVSDEAALASGNIVAAVLVTAELVLASGDIVTAV